MARTISSGDSFPSSVSDFGPGHGQPENRILLQFRLCPPRPFGGLHQIGGKPFFKSSANISCICLHQVFCVGPFRESRHRIAETRLGHGFKTEPGIEGLPFRHQLKKRATLVAQDIGKHLTRGIVGAVIAGQAKGYYGQPVGFVRLEAESSPVSRAPDESPAEAVSSFGGIWLEILLHLERAPFAAPRRRR